MELRFRPPTLPGGQKGHSFKSGQGNQGTQNLANATQIGLNVNIPPTAMLRSRARKVDPLHRNPAQGTWTPPTPKTHQLCRIDRLFNFKEPTLQLRSNIIPPLHQSPQCPMPKIIQEIYCKLILYYKHRVWLSICRPKYLKQFAISIKWPRASVWRKISSNYCNWGALAGGDCEWQDAVCMQ